MSHRRSPPLRRDAGFTLQHSSGFTLAELTVAMAIVTAVLFSVGTFTTTFRKTGDFLNEELLRQDDARRALVQMTKEIRAAAPSSCGAYPVEDAQDNSFTFFSNLDTDSTQERVRYFLQQGVVKKGVLNPTEPIDCTGTVYDPATEVVTDILSAVVNAQQNRPVFRYYGALSDATTPLASPPNPVEVYIVGITVILDADVSRPPAPLSLTSKVGIRTVQRAGAAPSPSPSAPPGAISSLTKTDGRPTAAPDDPLVVNVAPRNTSLVTATDVDVDDRLPSGVSIVPGSISHGGQYDSDDHAVEWDDLTIPPVTSTLSQGLVGYWRLDEGGGVYAADHSGNENLGQMREGASWSTTVPATNFLNLGSAQFNGQRSQLRVPNSPSLQVGGTDFTLALWIQPNAFGNWKTVFDKGTSSSRREYSFFIHSASQGRIAVGNTGGQTVNFSDNFQNSVWQHLTVRRQGTNVSIYRNGNRIAQITETATGTNTAALSFGRNTSGGGSTWDGLQDDIRLYNRALSSREIQTLAQGGGNQDNLSFKVTVNAGTPVGTVLTDTATSGSLTATDTTTVQLPAPALSTVSKTDGRSTTGPGQTLTYTSSILNDGNGPATGVTVTDVVPTYTTFVSGSITGGGTYNAATNTITWSNLSIPAFSTLTLTFRVTVNANAPDGGTITNTANVTAPGFSRSATDTTRIRSVTLSKTDEVNVTGPGQTLRYRITITNSSTTSLTGITVTDVVPTYTTITSGSITNGGQYNAGTNTITWSNLNVSASSSLQISFRVTVNANAPNGGVITNTAEVSSPSFSGTATDTTTISTIANLSSVSKTDGRTSVNTGATLTYSISIRNSGGGAATSVTVTDVVPTYTTFVSGSITGGGTYNAATNTITWSNLSIPAFSTLTLTFRVTVNANAPDGGTITNTANVTAPGFSRSATDTTTIIGVIAE